MKTRSPHKILSGVGKRWKVKYFANYEDAKNYFTSFRNLKKSAFVQWFDFSDRQYRLGIKKNGKPFQTGFWKDFK